MVWILGFQVENSQFQTLTRLSNLPFFSLSIIKRDLILNFRHRLRKIISSFFFPIFLYVVIYLQMWETTGRSYNDIFDRGGVVLVSLCIVEQFWVTLVEVWHKFLNDFIRRFGP